MEVKHIELTQEKEEVFDLHVKDNHNFFTDCGLVHNCHEVAAPKYREFLTYFKAAKVTGLTATPEREDGMTPVLKAYIGPIVEIDDLGEMKTKVHLLKSKFFYHFIGKKDKYHELLRALIYNKSRNRLIVEILKFYVEQEKKILCYSNRIRHMEILEKMAKESIPGVRTAILASTPYGKPMSIEEQEEVKNRAKNNEIDILFGGKIVEQGFNCEPLSVATLATPTKSARLIEQVLGRCQREYPGKKEAILVDIIDEKTKVLKFQFFAKNRKLYKKYRKEHGIPVPLS